MEDIKFPGSTENVVADSKDKPKSKKGFLLIFLGVALVGLLALGVFWLGIKDKEAKLSSIDDTLTAIDSLSNETEDVEKDFSDLPEDFIDAEPVSTQEIDTSLAELDTLMEELDGLDTDFELEASDVGL